MNCYYCKKYKMVLESNMAFTSLRCCNAIQSLFVEVLLITIEKYNKNYYIECRKNKHKAL